MMQNKIALAVHGGAGTILRSEMTTDLEAEYKYALKNAIETGWEILSRSGSSLDAVEATVVELENFPLFNAGRGAVFTHEGKNEMDASIMDGKSFKAGAVAFIKNVKNPVKLARLVMENTEHILLAGDGANKFAVQMNVDFEPDEYFYTEHRYHQFLNAREQNVIQLDHTADEADLIEDYTQLKVKSKMGTVGAVACDAFGNVAAATSTGGMTNKKYGRIGDTPLIGSGTYADNKTCAVSCTGHGEYFMLGVTAYDVAARMKYKNISLEQAANESIEFLTSIDGEGGLIAVDSSGNIALPFNSEGMYRGFISTDKEISVEIYRALTKD